MEIGNEKSACRKFHQVGTGKRTYRHQLPNCWQHGRWWRTDNAVSQVLELLLWTEFSPT